MTGLNRAVVSDPAAPDRRSQAERAWPRGGHEELLEYLESKYIAVQWWPDQSRSHSRLAGLAASR